MIGQSVWHAARCRDNVHIYVAVVLTAERDLRTIWREMRIEFTPDSSRQAARLAPLPAYDPKIVRVLEYNLCLTDSGVAKQQRLMSPSGDRRAYDGKKDKSTEDFR